MTTEDDFRAIINAHPDDHQTLAVFSDWLRERDDPRADGYAVLARLRRVPVGARIYGWFAAGRFSKTPDYENERVVSAYIEPQWHHHCVTDNRDTFTSFDAFDSAAVAFAKLPESRRVELLALEAVS